MHCVVANFFLGNYKIKMKIMLNFEFAQQNIISPYRLHDRIFIFRRSAGSSFWPRALAVLYLSSVRISVPFSCFVWKSRQFPSCTANYRLKIFISLPFSCFVWKSCQFPSCPANYRGAIGGKIGKTEVLPWFYKIATFIGWM